MEADRVERKLSAILAADVAGYSRLMGADEEGTLGSLNGHRREHVDPCVAKHRGRIVKTTGDGLLAEFASVVDAVRCAIEVQSGMAERNAGVNNDERIEFRIGINVGDIVEQDGDIFGDALWAQKALRERPDYLSALRVAAASAALAGRLGEAREAMERLRRIDHALRVSNLNHRLPLRRPEDLAKYEEGLRKAGLPE